MRTSWFSILYCLVLVGAPADAELEASEAERVQELPKVAVSAELPLYKTGEYHMLTERWGPAVCEKAGVLYIVGGVDLSNVPVDTIEAFDLRTHTSRIVGRLHQARSFAGAVLVGDDLYILGGKGYRHERRPMGKSALALIDESVRMRQLRAERVGDFPESEFYEPLKSIEVFNLSSGKVSKYGDMPACRSVFGCVALDRAIYVIGGRLEAHGEYDRSSDMSCLNVDSGEWTAKAPVPVSREGDCVFVPGHFVVAIGGYNGRRTMNEVCVYDLLADSWARLPDLDQNISAHASVWAGSHVFCFGNYMAPDEILVYDLKTRGKETFTLKYTPTRHATAIEVGGRIYVVGGKATKEMQPLDLIQEFTLTQSAN